MAGSGAVGPGAAIIRFGVTDVILNIRLVRLGNIQVANAYNDGQWAYERNLLRCNDRDLSLMWSGT